MPAQQPDNAARFAQISQILTGTSEERDKARWQALVVDVMRSLQHLTPYTRSYPSLLDGVTLEDLRRGLKGETPDPVMVGAFLQWRADVTHLEQANAKRLRTVATALEFIGELRGRGRTDEVLERYEARLHEHLKYLWKLDPPGPKDNARSWSDKHARRMDLLPESWRDL